MTDTMNKDPCPPDQRTPRPTPSPQQGGEFNEPGVTEDNLAQVNVVFYGTFAVSKQWFMPSNPNYDSSLYYFMVFFHYCKFPCYPKGIIFTRE